MMRWKVKKEDVLLYGQNKMSQASLGKVDGTRCACSYLIIVESL